MSRPIINYIVEAATKLLTSRRIGGVLFDGTADIDLPGVNQPGNQDTTGNASAATVLATARTINGTSFNGSANITTANWGTARSLTVGNTAKSVNGSTNVAWTLAEIGAADNTVQVIAGTGLSGGGTLAANRTLNVAYGTAAGTAAEGNDPRILSAVPDNRTLTAGTGLTGGGDLTTNRSFAVVYGVGANTAAQGNDSRILNGQTAFSWGDHRTEGYIKSSTDTGGEGGVALADIPDLPASKITSGVLATARIPTLNQNTTGSAATLTTARTLTVGLTGKAFNGSTNVAWTLAEIGAVALTDSRLVEITEAEVTAGSSTALRTISGRRIKQAVDDHGLKIGTTSTTAAAGNDPRILNGVTAHSWGNHANAGYIKSSAGTGGVSVDDIPDLDAGKITSGVFAAARIPTLNQPTTGNAASATKLNTARVLTIGRTGKSFNGTAAVTWTLAEILPTGGTTANFLRGDGTWAIVNTENTTYTAGAGLTLTGTAFSLPVTVSGSGTHISDITQTATGITVTKSTPPNTNTTYVEIPSAEVTAGTASTLRTITGRRLKEAVDAHGLQLGTTASTAKAGNWTPAAGDMPNLDAGKITTGVFAAARIPTLNQATTANAGSATVLQTSRTLTIGSTGKTFNGSANVAWTLAEIGAAAASHTHTTAQITGLDTALSGKAPTVHTHANISITAGTGLSGGGTLAATRALSVNYGTEAATAAQGNDSRIINGQTAFSWGDHASAGYIKSAPIPGNMVTTDTTQTISAAKVFSNTANSTSATTGSVQVRGGLGVSSNIWAGGNITAYSDRKLKSDIEVIEEPIAKIKQVRGITYTRKDTGHRETGVIAQELQAVLPEAVHGDKTLGVDYGRVVGLLIEGIKELTDRVEFLEQQLANK